MYQVLLVIHVMVTLALIGIILVQRNAGDGMGLSGSSSSSFLSGRSIDKGIVRVTTALAVVFILCSLALGILTARNHPSAASFIDKMDAQTKVTAPATPAAPAKEPAKPAVPRPE